MPALARALRLSPRTLARRIHTATGQPPLAMIQRLEVETAVHRLETSDRSFEEIAHAPVIPTPTRPAG